MLIPMIIVMGIYYKWALKVETILYATARMVVQLLLVGYALLVLFKQSSPYISSSIILVMFVVAAWIALRPIKQYRRKYYYKALIAITAGGLPILILVIFGVIGLKPWYAPRYLIPLAGMIFANSMNSVSLCAERLHAEVEKGVVWNEARGIAYQTGLIPLVNSFFAVGLVSLPGMMTGQILAGMSPLMAVRYQIMVMCMVLGAAGIACAVFLCLIRRSVICERD
jgi:putative ABC transport system permease protein